MKGKVESPPIYPMLQGFMPALYLSLTELSDQQVCCLPVLSEQSFVTFFLVKFQFISLKYSINPLGKLDWGRHPALAQLQKDAFFCCPLVSNYSLLLRALVQGQMKPF